QLEGSVFEKQDLETLIHELVHIKIKGHSSEFTQLYNQLMHYWSDDFKENIIKARIQSLTCWDNKQYNAIKKDQLLISKKLKLLTRTSLCRPTNPNSQESTLYNIALLIHLYQTSPDNLNKEGLTEDELIDIGLKAIYKHHSNGLDEQKMQVIEALPIGTLPPSNLDQSDPKSYCIQLIKKLRDFFKLLHAIFPRIIDLKKAKDAAKLIWSYSRQLWFDLITIINALIDMFFPQTYDQ
ncbi:12149_t:CDS:2, partial [Cetraspora pellucida]